MVLISDLLSQYEAYGSNLGEASGPLDLTGGGVGPTGRRRQEWQTSAGPQMWALFARWAGARGGPIDQATRGAFAERVAGLVSGEEEARRESAAAAASAGLSPSMFDRIQAENSRNYLNQVGQARAQSEREAGEAQFNLAANTTAAINDEIARQDALLHQDYLAAKARSAARAGSRSALLGSIIGAAGTIAGGALGGPIGAAIGSQLFSAGGGAGAGMQGQLSEFNAPLYRRRPSYGYGNVYGYENDYGTKLGSY